jgi:hypothetical protein
VAATAAVEGGVPQAAGQLPSTQARNIIATADDECLRYEGASPLAPSHLPTLYRHGTAAVVGGLLPAYGIVS